MNNKSSIDSWVTQSIHRLLDAGIPSARLDAELIISHTLRKGRTWLHAHGDEPMDVRYRDIADARLALRLDRVPIAYIIGHKEFYGRRFTVTTATLVPRPESETIIELIQELPLKPNMKVVDVGTGSGCLGITTKLEHPELDVTLTDISTHALNVAEKNAIRLGALVTCMQSDLLVDYPYAADIIIANLPYVDQEWERSPETEHEPHIALFAKDNGLLLIKKLIDQCQGKLARNGYLFIESDRKQQHLIDTYAEQHGLAHYTTRGFISVYRPV
jgi:release factor glutamine methyltransferase